MNFLDAPAPTEGLGPEDMARAANARPSLGDYLGASLAEGFWGTGASQMQANNRVFRAGVVGTLDPAENAPLSDREWVASDFHRDGLAYRPGMTVAMARELAAMRDENVARRNLIGARDAGVVDTVLGFGAGMVGALPTPENFIPFAGPALNAARAGRFGAYMARLGETTALARGGTLGARAAVGAGSGAIDAFMGNLVAMPVVHGSREEFGDDITWVDVVQDLALGTVGGAVLGGGLGAAARPHTVKGELPPAIPPSAATQDAALRALTGAAAQLADGGDINLAMASPALRAEVEGLRAEQRRLRSMLQPEADASLSGQVAARPLMPTADVAPGAVARATTPAGMDVHMAYDVVEADSLIASHQLPDFTENPAFASELQPRDRSTAERQQQVRTMAARPRPEELHASPSTTTGAPIVGPDGLVESGNGRVLAIASAYREGLPTAQAYRASLTRAGFDAAAEMREPVLIRRRTTELTAEQRQRFVNDSNVAQIDTLTAGEQARVDGQVITPAMLGLVRSNDLAAAANADFTRAFIEALPGREQRAFSREGALTPDGLTRLRRAMAARAYDDPALLTRLTESADGATEAIGRGLMDAAPTVAQLRAAREAGTLRPELDAIAALVRATQRIQAVRDANLPLRSALDQLDLFGDVGSATERAWLELLLRHPGNDRIGGVGRESIAERIGAYARHASEAPDRPDMFGTAPPGLGDVMAATFREAGITPPRELNALRADTYAPPPDAAPEPPPALPRAEGDPIARAADERGLDVHSADAQVEAKRLTETGRLPPELASELDAANAQVAQLEKAPEAWQAAATCVIRA